MCNTENEGTEPVGCSVRTYSHQQKTVSSQPSKDKASYNTACASKKTENGELCNRLCVLHTSVIQTLREGRDGRDGFLVFSHEENMNPRCKERP